MLILSSSSNLIT
uniref:Uncharacterized protein n=1 Tax=Arundo donax TaxID=35708 RepID=A0A0A9AG74_ARUDO